MKLRDIKASFTEISNEERKQRILDCRNKRFTLNPPAKDAVVVIKGLNKL